MTVAIPLTAIHLQEGSLVSISSLVWQDWEDIINELGENRQARVAYYQGTLEIMSPRSIHERPHRIIAYIVTAILDAQGRDWEDFGSTTFYRRGIAGIEPDTCFYVHNSVLVRECQGRIDVDIYPPPDLAIESDVTSKTFLSAYQGVGVPELWIYANHQLQIYVIKDGRYFESKTSLIFPDLDIRIIIPELVNQAMKIGASSMLREFRKSLQNAQKES